MIKVKKVFSKKGKSGGAKAFLFGMLISVVSFFVFSALAAILASSADNPTGSVGIYSLLALTLSAAVSGALISRMGGQGGMRFSLICSLCTVLLMALYAIITTGGAPKSAALMNYICYIGVSALFSFLGRKREGHRARRKR